MDSIPVSQEIPIPLPILLDGGTGTGLFAYGYDRSVSAAQFVSLHPDALIKLQQGFIDSGAQVLYTATHGANRENLKAFGCEDMTEQLNASAAKITYDNFHDKALIAGCLSSTGLYIEPYGDYTFTEIMSVYRQQVSALSPYCDMFVIETVPTLWNMRAAVLACKKENKPIIATMKVDEDGDTDIGTNVLCALLVLQEMGISAFGLNCTSANLCPDIIAEIAPYAKIPLIVKPSAVYEKDGERVLVSPEEFACAVKKSVTNGARIVGGCCGAGKEHIAALRDMLGEIDYDKLPAIEKQDTTLALATENQMFFLDPDTTEFSPAVECGPYMEDDIADMCSQSFDVLTVSINSPDDAIDFGRNMHMATLPVAFLSDDEISLKMALMLYQGRAIIDSNSLIEPEKLSAMAEKYGAVLY